MQHFLIIQSEKYAVFCFLVKYIQIVSFFRRVDMIGKIQGYTPFNGVYIKRGGKTQSNIKKAYIDLKQNNDSNGIISMTEFQRTAFNATLDYGLKRLNDEKNDDGKTRYLTLNPLYDDKSGKLSGYDLGIVENDGNVVTTASSYMDGVGVQTLKNAFDTLSENYKDTLSRIKAEKYSKPFSVDSVIAPYITKDGPDIA